MEGGGGGVGLAQNAHLVTSRLLRLRQKLFPLRSAKMTDDFISRDTKCIFFLQPPSWIRHLGCFHYFQNRRNLSKSPFKLNRVNLVDEKETNDVGVKQDANVLKIT